MTDLEVTCRIEEVRARQEAERHWGLCLVAIWSIVAIALTIIASEYLAWVACRGGL